MVSSTDVRPAASLQCRTCGRTKRPGTPDPHRLVIPAGQRRQVVPPECNKGQHHWTPQEATECS